MDVLVQLLDATIRVSVPLLLACLAGLYSERSGVFDIGLEGKMLAGAFIGASAAAVSGSAWIGLLAAVGISVFFALVHAPQYGLNLAILALFAVSVVFGLVRSRYGTTASIIAHALYNALQLLALIASKS